MRNEDKGLKSALYLFHFLFSLKSESFCNKLYDILDNHVNFE